VIDYKVKNRGNIIFLFKIFEKDHTMEIKINGEKVEIDEQTHRVAQRLSVLDNLTIPQAIAKLAELGAKNTPEFIKIPD